MATRIQSRVAVATATAAALFMLAGCAAGADTDTSSSAEPTEGGMPLPEFSQELHDSLPAEIQESGVLRLATITLPPYSQKGEDGVTYEGINFDTVAAMEAALGIEIDLEVAPTSADIYTGFESDKYDAGISPLSDIPATQANYDFAVWIAEYVVFLQQKTADDKIEGLDDTCGHTIATLQGGTAQKVLEAQQAECDTPIDISLFADQDTAILAVKSGRADAAFSSQIPLTYYVSQDDTLEISGANSTDNGFPPFWVGAFAPKEAPIVPVLLDTFNALKDAGTYDFLLEKYGIEENAMDEFGFNLAEDE
ncbi:polar amino acid transport system substrate-binding protein [Conyzicola lurida]|uniref:Polar amino acid transport system substrate-binding protein n=1 Tax=Conyzicola lurida TaxID=1172621 RepID=A0A841AFD7_9MICO|nr:transporter substrate-binding domain-containing protein [Conyzicola lurida]MBB5841957.1 polar amino acid transport system substrate-binding protein [Conyzicola lurida]